MADKMKTLPKEEALVLARQGKDAWNAWAEENPAVSVDFSNHDFTEEIVYFGRFIFPGAANFNGAIFENAVFSGAQFSGGSALFSRAIFKGKTVNFNSAKFCGGRAEFADAKFTGGEADFGGAVFSGGVADFGKVEFSGGHAIFINAKFKGGYTNFKGARFGAGAYFAHARFKNAVFFIDSEFNGQSYFAQVTFGGPVHLEGSRFKEVPDLRRSTMPVHFTLHDIEVGYVTSSEKVCRVFKKAATASDADKFRRLKELAVQARDHEREQDFFAKELKAKRFYETKGLALCWSYGYEWFSDFGRSVSRPFFSLFALWLLWGIGYWYSTLQYLDFINRFYLPMGKLHEALKLSLATIVPFFAISREEFHDSKSAITGENASLLLDLAMVFEGVLAVIFIFLIGLALRNRFRI